MRDKSYHPDVRKQTDPGNVSLLFAKWSKSPEEQIPCKSHQNQNPFLLAMANVFYLNTPPLTFLLPPDGEMESVSSFFLPLERQIVQIILRPSLQAMSKHTTTAFVIHPFPIFPTATKFTRIRMFFDSKWKSEFCLFFFLRKTP